MFKGVTSKEYMFEKKAVIINIFWPDILLAHGLTNILFTARQECKYVLPPAAVRNVIKVSKLISFLQHVFTPSFILLIENSRFSDIHTSRRHFCIHASGSVWIVGNGMLVCWYEQTVILKNIKPLCSFQCKQFDRKTSVARRNNLFLFVFVRRLFINL